MAPTGVAPETARARLAVFGLGYVGSVSAACFAARGHEVVGVDVDAHKVEAVAAGRSPVLEAGVAELLRDALQSGLLTATTDTAAAVSRTDVALVCVGTPSLSSGAVELASLERVCDDIGQALPGAPPGYVVVIRSTVPPGTCDSVVVPRLEKASGLVHGHDFHVCFSPEFLREGSSVSDFLDPPKSVVGSNDPQRGAEVIQLYDGLPGPKFVLPVRAAEMVKYVDNAFHAVKVTFANEVGALAKAFDVDSHTVMDCFCADTKLNLSPSHLRPGFAFGGSCLPKDLRALTYAARHADLALPLLDAVLPSNEAHIARALDLITDLDATRIALFGLSFKPGTDDLRESPMVTLAERLIGKGIDLRIYDPDVTASALLGANAAWVARRIPHLSARLHKDPADAVRDADVVVIATLPPEAAAALEHEERSWVIDLTCSGTSTVLRRSHRYRSLVR